VVEPAHREYGLQSPDGKSHYGSFIARPITTEQERGVLATVLRQFARELGWPEEEFVGRYKWTSRVITPEDIAFNLEDPAVAPALQEGPPPGVVPDQLPPAEPVRATGE
jgi:hypothetical protein